MPLMGAILRLQRKTTPQNRAKQNKTTQHPQEEVENMEKLFIVWYRVDGEEDFAIIPARDEEEARRWFYGTHDSCITDIHEIEDDERYLAYC